MSFARPARCLFCSFSRAATMGTRVPRRQFQLSAAQFANKDPKPSDDRQSLPQLQKEMKPESFKPYTEEEKARLREQYTPEQMAAIEAGEAAIDPKDLAEQFRVRTDLMRLEYLDDFSTIEPGVDKPVRAPQTNTDYNAKLKTQDDFVKDLGQIMEEMPEGATNVDFMKRLATLRMTTGKEENELNPHSVLLPDLFNPGKRIDEENNVDPATLPLEGHEQRVDRKDEEPTDALITLMKMTKYDAKEIQRLKSRVLVSHRVVNQTRLGKIQSQYVLAVAGNGNGLLGIGEGKSEEQQDAQTQALYRAIRNMQPVPRYENRTIFGDVTGKSGAVELKLMSRPPGFGLRCQSLIYEMCRAAGITDIAARVDRSRNHMNTVKAAYKALMSQRNPEDVARARGKKLVDVRKVYYSGKAMAES
ncbi:ribosomal protein S5, C-terminal domain-containing protein [Aspergillus karnatakaensis]|uniref:mitochondrial 37S ribosomal protein uS5m n=1 Tax=Aspergillus karnatakaensis TaxID=1810916 RepID=UPI003CCD9BC9